MMFQHLNEQEEFSATPTTPEFYIEQTHARTRAQEAQKDRRVVHVVSGPDVVLDIAAERLFSANLSCGQPFPVDRSASGFASVSAVISLSNETSLLDGCSRYRSVSLWPRIELKEYDRCLSLQTTDFPKHHGGQTLRTH